MTFTVTVDDLPGENVYDSDSDSWIENPVKDFTFYKISYTMKVKDREALTEAALGSDAYTVVMGNTITSVLGSDSTTVEYTPKVLEKYKGNEVDGRIEFTIKVTSADGEDVCYVNVSVRDEKGLVVPNAKVPVRFEIEGPGVIVATDNGDETDFDDFRKPERKTFNGWAQAIVRAVSGKSGDITVKAHSGDGIAPSSVTVSSILPSEAGGK